MTSARVLAAVCVAAIVATASAATVGSGAGPASSNVVFSITGELPDGLCPGLYAVDSRTRAIISLGGWDARRQDFALYPSFTAGGKLSHAHLVDSTSSPVPLVDVYAGDRRAARAVAGVGWAWSPRREELAFERLADGGRTLELVLASASGATRVVGRRSALRPAWTQDGGGLVYERHTRSAGLIAFVRRDGRGRRDLATGAVMPAVSPDGSRVAFLRELSGTRVELWIVGTRRGRARKVLGPAALESLAPVVWLSNSQLLVQHNGRYDSLFNLGDTVKRLDVDTGVERPFLKRAFALSVSPDRSRVLFVRPHRGDDTYYSIRAVGIDGRDEQLLAVTDGEDMNLRSFPVWTPAAAPVGWAGDPAPSGLQAEECVRRVTALRDRTR